MFIRFFLYQFFLGILIGLNAQDMGQRKFTTAEGLPTVALNASFSTANGYLWLFSNSGLVQYDGTQFRTLHLPNLKSADFLGYNAISSHAYLFWSNQDALLYKDGNIQHVRYFQKGDKYGLLNGLFTYKNGIGAFTEKGILWMNHSGKVAHFNALSSQPLQGVIDAKQRLWYIDENGAIWQKDKNKIRQVWGKFPMQNPYKMVLQPNHSLWILAENATFEYTKNGNWRQLPDFQNGQIIQQEKNWKLVKNAQNLVQLWHKKNEEWQFLNAQNLIDLSYTPFVTQTPDGSLWLSALTFGLTQFYNKPFYPKFEGEGFLSAQFAPDGSLWLVKDGTGILHHKNGVTQTYSTQNGLNANYAWGVLPRKNGEVWMALENGLMLLKNEKLTAIGKKQGLPIDDFKAYTLYESPKGDFYVGATRLDRSEKLWGVYQWNGNRFEALFNPHSSVSALLQSKEGALWIGTYNQGLWRFKDGKAIHLPQSAQMHINALYEDEKGHLFVGTEYHGLGFFKDNRLLFFNTKNGLYENTIWAILEDKKGNLWTSGERGIATFPKSQVLNATIKDKIAAIGFSALHGVAGSSCSGGSQPVATQDSAGNLYFPCVEGVTVVPSAKQIQALNPQIVSVESDTQIYNYQPNLQLQSTERHLRFSFTAVNFMHSQNVTLFYCLDEGNGCKEWKASTHNFVASYANLKNGNYIFRVKNNEAQEAQIKIYIPPYFYETWWFRMLVLAFILGLGYALYQYKLQRETQKKYQTQLETDIQKATLALKAAEKRKSLFIQGLSHDFKTPLTTIKTPIEGKRNLSNQSESISFLRSDIEIMWESVRRLERYVEDFLMMAKAESGLMPMVIDPQATHLYAFLLQISTGFKPQFEQKQIVFKLLTDAECFVSIDQLAIERVLLNLLSNAYKFTPVGGTIILAAHLKDGLLEIEVRDNGLGVSAKELPHLFERFYSGQGNERIGTGLGLSICKILVELHGGNISAVALEKGTAFLIKIPQPETIAKADEVYSEMVMPQEQVTLEKSILPIANTHPYTLLLVEDDDVLQGYMKQLLSPYYNILTAWNGEEALALLAHHQPDIILSDVMMSPGDGLSLCKAVKLSSKWQHIPFILLSARGSAIRQLEGFEVGAEDYIAKPFNQDILLYRIEKWLVWKNKLNQKEALGQDPIYDLPLPSHNEDREWLLSVILAIEKHLAAVQFDVNELANVVFMHPKTLDRRLKSLLGAEITTAQLIKHIKLLQAAFQLRNSRNTIENIAQQVGYVKVDYFRKIFKAKFGKTPDEYRKENESHLN